jgi:hypothetical protein
MIRVVIEIDAKPGQALTESNLATVRVVAQEMKERLAFLGDVAVKVERGIPNAPHSRAAQ